MESTELCSIAQGRTLDRAGSLALLAGSVAGRGNPSWRFLLLALAVALHWLAWRPARLDLIGCCTEGHQGFWECCAREP